jgi:exodeoxyribonuclease-3
MRLDHLLLSPDLAPRLRAAGVDREARGLDGASDHAPTWIELEPPSKRPPRRASPTPGARRSAGRTDRADVQ